MELAFADGIFGRILCAEYLVALCHHADYLHDFSLRQIIHHVGSIRDGHLRKNGTIRYEFR